MEMPVGERAVLFKDKSGISWFLGIYSNNFEDRQGEILTQAAHEEYVTWANEKGIKPPIIMMHQPKFPDLVHLANFALLLSGKTTSEEFNATLMKMYASTAVAQTQALVTKNGFVFVLGKVLPEKLPIVEKLFKQARKWGMSHGFIPLIKRDNIVEGYRTFEFTLTPIDLAANKFTAIGFKEVKMDDVLQTLPEEAQELLNEDKLAEATQTAKDVLQKFVASKELVEEKTEEVPEPAGEYAMLRQNLFTDFKMEELGTALKTIGEKLQSQDALITKQGETIETLLKTITELQKSEDQRIAEQFTSPNWMVPSFARKMAEPTPEEQEKIQQIKAELPAVVTEKSQTDNPMNLGFWNMFGS